MAEMSDEWIGNERQRWVVIGRDVRGRWMVEVLNVREENGKKMSD